MKSLKTQLEQIQHLYNLSREDIELIKWESHHPEYPDSIKDLMSYISSSDWIHREYNKFNQIQLFENISKANIEEIMAAITYINRSERWVTGSWKTIMERDDLTPVLKRAAELLKKKTWFQKIFPLKCFVPNRT